MPEHISPLWYADMSPVDWDSPTWGHNPVHIASFVDVSGECAEADQ